MPLSPDSSAQQYSEAQEIFQAASEELLRAFRCALSARIQAFFAQHPQVETFEWLQSEALHSGPFGITVVRINGLGGALKLRHPYREIEAIFELFPHELFFQALASPSRIIASRQGMELVGWRKAGAG